MDETYGTYVDDECFDIHDYDDDDTDHDTDDDTNDGTDDDTDDGGRGNRRPLPGGAVHFLSPPWSPRAYKFLGFGSRLGEGKGEGKPRCSNTPQDPGGVGGFLIVPRYWVHV